MRLVGPVPARGSGDGDLGDSGTGPLMGLWMFPSSNFLSFRRRLIMSSASKFVAVLVAGRAAGSRAPPLVFNMVVSFIRST